MNELACFSGPFVPCFFFGIFSWQLDSAPSILLSGAAALALVPTRQAEKTLPKKRKSDFLSIVLPLMYPSSHEVTFVKGYIPSSVYGFLRDRAQGFSTLFGVVKIWLTMGIEPTVQIQSVFELPIGNTGVSHFQVSNIHFKSF